MQWIICFFFSSRRRHTRCALVTGVQTCALPISQVEVTSVSKRAERLSDAPAAIYVITSEDIRRSTATSLPEALRLAPNLLVQQIDARQYSIGARGFNGYETSNKLLGLIDGRTKIGRAHV